MKNYRKGFTILELLVVIAIIGLLAALVVTSARSNRKKANIAALKSEATSAYNSWSALCLATDLSPNPNTKSTNWGALTQNCGPEGDGTFGVIATSTYEPACTANITQLGIAYSSGCN